MPIKGKTAQAASPQAAQGSEFQVYVRLRRMGAQDHLGLSSHYFRGKLYSRSKVYRVTDPELAQALRATRKYEFTTDETELSEWKQDAKKPRGGTLAQARRGGADKDRGARTRDRRAAATELDTGARAAAPSEEVDTDSDEVGLAVEGDEAGDDVDAIEV